MSIHIIARCRRMGKTALLNELIQAELDAGRVCSSVTSKHTPKPDYRAYLEARRVRLEAQYRRPTDTQGRVIADE